MVLFATTTSKPSPLPQIFPLVVTCLRLPAALIRRAIPVAAHPDGAKLFQSLSEVQAKSAAVSGTIEWPPLYGRFESNRQWRLILECRLWGQKAAFRPGNLSEDENSAHPHQ